MMLYISLKSLLVVMLCVATTAVPTVIKSSELGHRRKSVEANGHLSQLLRRMGPDHFEVSSAVSHSAMVASLLEESSDLADVSDNEQGDSDVEGNSLEGGVVEEQIEQERFQIEQEQLEHSDAATPSPSESVSTTYCYDQGGSDECSAADDQCKWHGETSGEGLCFNKACHTYDQVLGCQENNVCEWNDVDEKCYAKNCQMLTSASWCHGNVLCSWNHTENNSDGVCLPKPCSQFNGKSNLALACEMNQLCQFNEINSTCEAQFCPGYSWDECNTYAWKGCVWDVNECKACHRLTQDTCGSGTNESSCNWNKNEGKCMVTCSAFGTDDCENSFHPACGYSEAFISASDQNPTKMFPNPVAINKDSCNRVCANRESWCHKFHPSECGENTTLLIDCPETCNQCVVKCETKGNSQNCSTAPDAICSWCETKPQCLKRCPAIKSKEECGRHDECEWSSSTCQPTAKYPSCPTSASMIQDADGDDTDENDSSDGQDDSIGDSNSSDRDDSTTSKDDSLGEAQDDTEEDRHEDGTEEGSDENGTEDDSNEQDEGDKYEDETHHAHQIRNKKKKTSPRHRGQKVPSHKASAEDVYRQKEKLRSKHQGTKKGNAASLSASKSHTKRTLPSLLAHSSNSEAATSGSSAEDPDNDAQDDGDAPSSSAQDDGDVDDDDREEQQDEKKRDKTEEENKQKARVKAEEAQEAENGDVSDDSSDGSSMSTSDSNSDGAGSNDGNNSNSEASSTASSAASSDSADSSTSNSNEDSEEDSNLGTHDADPDNVGDADDHYTDNAAP